MGGEGDYCRIIGFGSFQKLKNEGWHQNIFYLADSQMGMDPASAMVCLMYTQGVNISK